MCMPKLKAIRQPSLTSFDQFACLISGARAKVRTVGGVIAAILSALARGARFRAQPIFLLLLIAASTSHAVSGECRWEGGLGASPLNPNVSQPRDYCRFEDCSTGSTTGLAKCTAPRITTEYGVPEAKAGDDKWAFKICDRTNINNDAAWCEVSGAQWLQ